MSITFDNAVVKVRNTVSFAFTVGANANRILIAIGNDAGAGQAGVGTATYGGVAMTAIDTANFSSANRATIFILFAPATGSNTFTGTTWSQWTLYSYYNTSQLALDGHTFGFDNTGVATATSSITSVVANTLQFAGGYYASSAAATPILTFTGLPNNQNVTTSAGVAGYFGGDSGATATAGTLVTQTVSDSTSPSNGVIFQISLAPFTVIATRSDSILNGASRTITLARSVALTRTVSLSIMNAASRFAAVARNRTFNLSASFMNAASRLVTIHAIGGIWTTVVKHTSTFVQGVKDASTWANGTKHTSTFNNQVKD